MTKREFVKQWGEYREALFKENVKQGKMRMSEMVVNLMDDKENKTAEKLWRKYREHLKEAASVSEFMQAAKQNEKERAEP